MGGLDRMRQRMVYVAGDPSEDRNVREKYLSFQSAINDPYQAEIITFNERKYQCLINPDKLKESYDQKEISIDFEAGMKAGDVFYWDRTESYWLVFLEEHTEEAYFRASIRKCNFKMYDDWVWLRGPIEAALVWKQKHNIEYNDLNYSILFYVVASEENLNRYTRLNIVKFDGHNWKVAAVDKYSQPGIIEVYLEEHFDNEMEDAVTGPEIVDPDFTMPYIDGPLFVKPYDENVSFSIVGLSNGSFVVNSSKVEIVKTTSTTCVLNIITGKSGAFNICYQEPGEPDVYLDVTIQSF